MSVRTQGRRLHTAGLAWKRPRYVSGAKEPHRARAVLLPEDETTLRLLPPRRAAWAPRGQQATVPIRGKNDPRVLFVTLNAATDTA